MLNPDQETRRLLVREHQAELRQQAQRARSGDEPSRLLTMVALSRPPARRGARNWLRWRRRSTRRAAHAS